MKQHNPNPQGLAARRPLWERMEDRLLFDAVPDTVFQVLAGAAASLHELNADIADTAVSAEARSSAGHELVFVDTSVESLDTLLQEVSASGSYEVIFLDPTRDGLRQIADELLGRQNVEALHILSHGAGGRLALGDSVVDIHSLDRDAAIWKAIGQSLGDGGDILFYGCNLAESEAGQHFVQRIAELTSADVAASVDATGADALGGDWDLEYQWGVVDVMTMSLDGLSTTLDLEITPAANNGAVRGLFDNQLVGTGVTTTGFSRIGSRDQFGSYTNDDEGLGASRVPFSDGVVIVTGKVTSAASPAGNTVDTTGSAGISTTSSSNRSDSDLQALSGNQIFDAVGFSFTMNSTTDRVGIVFSFASDEFPEFVGTIFNDAFGFFIQGGTEFLTKTNVALVPGSTDGVAVNTINNGQMGAWGLANPGSQAPWTGAHSDLFIPNSIHDPTDGTVGPYLEYDGLTVPLLVEIDLTRAVDYSLKIALGDSGDTQWDSAVFFQTNGLFALTSATDNAYSVTNAQTVAGNLITDDTGDNIDVDPEDGQSTLSVIEIDGVALTGGAVTLASGATLTIAADGTFDYDPTTSSSLLSLAPGASAIDTFTYTIIDDIGVTDTATVTMTVTGVARPVIDLNGADQAGMDFATAFVEGGSAVAIADLDATVSDLDGTELAELTIAVSGVADAGQELVTIAGVSFDLSASASQTVTVGAASFSVSFDSGAGVFTITDGGGGNMANADVEALLSAIAYQNASVLPTEGNRGFTFIGVDVDGHSSTAAASWVSVTRSAEVGVWSVSGDSAVDEGAVAQYLVQLSGAMRADETASVQLTLAEQTTSAADHAAWTTAVGAAVLAYNSGAGPGALNWDGTTLTFTSDGTGAMAPLSVQLNIMDDTLVEGPESLVVNLASAGTTTGQSISIDSLSGQATTEIADTIGSGGPFETATWTLSGDASVVEGGSALYQFSMVETLQDGESVQLTLALSGVTAVAADYGDLDTVVSAAVTAYNSSGAPGSLSYTAGNLTFLGDGSGPMSTWSFSLPTVDDIIFEGDETYRLELSSPTSATGAAVAVNISSLDTSILDNDSAPTVTIGDGSATEGDWVVFDVTLSNPTSATVSLDLALSGTASAGADYLAALDYSADGVNWLPATSDTIVEFAPGEVSLDVRLPTLNDLVVEESEFVAVTVNAVVSGSVGGTSDTGSLQITDNDAGLVEVSASDPTAAEPSENGQFTVTLSAASSTSTTVAYTVSGSATPGADFSPLSGTVTIAAGATSATIDVSVLDDSVLESSETVVVTLTTIASGDADFA
ncbi:MAG: DUF4347 domain-containing protein, partial [Planctomycetales bacterium]|nr:DUF4347 domain-containing protein [Planctomycetales bacterium]